MQRRIITLFIITILIISILSTITALPYLITPTNNTIFQQTQITKLHELGYDGSNILIGIIDTGTDSNHPEFSPTTFIGWKDTITNQTTYTDDSDHGTHLSGILTAQGSYNGLLSNIHLTGIAPKCQLLIIKTIPEHQYYHHQVTTQSITTAITYCIEQHTDIILLTLGPHPETITNLNTTQLTHAITNATNHGIYVIIPAGNTRNTDINKITFPATLENVITVGATTPTNTIASFSTKGHQYPTTQDPHKKPEIVAPGTNILSTRTHNAYGQQSGTQQAATITAGILALILQAYPQYQTEHNQNLTTINHMKEALAQTALKIGSLQHTKQQLSHDDSYGYGLIQAYALYEYLGQN